MALDLVPKKLKLKCGDITKEQGCLHHSTVKKQERWSHVGRHLQCTSRV